jgi:sulfate adenylyltransferase
MSKGPFPKTLISPYGGKLVNLVVRDDCRDVLIQKAKRLPSVQISSRSVCDLELLATGAFSPLERFMGEQDYRSVLKDMRLSDGTLMPIPVTLPVDNVDGLAIGKELVLRSPTNEMLAIMRLDEIFAWNLDEECTAVLGTTDSRHPLVSEMHRWGRYYLSGPLTVLNLPRHNDFRGLRSTPADVRAALEAMGRVNVVAYQPRHPMHRAHETLTKEAVEEIDGSLLIQPVVGVTAYSDLDHYTRVRCYEALFENYYDPGRTLLNLVPLAVRMAGPRAGLWHGIINRNYGANHFIIGRDPHGPGKDSQGKDFYDTFDVQRLFREQGAEIGVRIIPHKEMVYVPRENRYEESGRIVNGTEEYIRVSATTVIEDSLFRGKRLPEWFTYPEVAQILYEANPPRTRQGFCVWLTGLPSSGKSTIADVLAPLLLSSGRRVTVLDGDVVRTHLTKGLGFSKEDRITNILRVGFVASEVVRHEGVAICALISPFASARDQVRAMVGAERFVEVFVDTPVDVCEVRDVKGMYTKAKRGEIKGFTGVDDAYEPPCAPEVCIDTAAVTAEESARQIMEVLVRKGFLAALEKRVKHSSDSMNAAVSGAPEASAVIQGLQHVGRKLLTDSPGGKTVEDMAGGALKLPKLVDPAGLLRQDLRVGMPKNTRDRQAVRNELPVLDLPQNKPRAAKKPDV